MFLLASKPSGNRWPVYLGVKSHAKCCPSTHIEEEPFYSNQRAKMPLSALNKLRLAWLSVFRKHNVYSAWGSVQENIRFKKKVSKTSFLSAAESRELKNPWMPEQELKQIWRWYKKCSTWHGPFYEMCIYDTHCMLQGISVRLNTAYHHELWAGKN